MKFTIDKVEGSNTWVTFTFDDGSTSSQTIANLPVDDEKALTESLTEYAKAYLAGLATVKDPVAGLVGKTLDAVE